MKTDRRKFSKTISKIIPIGLITPVIPIATSCESNQIGPEKSLTIAPPESHEELVAGEAFTLKWISSGVENIDIAYKVDNAASWLTIEREYPAAPGNYTFDVFRNINGKVLTFRISDAIDETFSNEGTPLKIIFKFEINLDNYPQLKEDGGIVEFDDGSTDPFVVQNTGGDSFRSLSKVCTHQGCVIDLQGNSGFACPCHGSQFNIDGSVTKGPAERNLDEIRLEKVDDSTLIAYV
ncbi:ubiquinol-cytochrome c reductase iron-sulfur subunit [Flexithrix dorotheae]|uniref:QcrA and Rieske domain-containing protein n=1 Tax=Flexithrix dorotheae TaxID=70993 RepID=UPI0003721B68|nr:ubiquinol-cytochrome c reductase iron-sulfur subunit [Flexithrix dorotheae]